ncbi:MAG: DUF6816 family protein, partial [Cyanobacteria bacterium J06649_4]
MPTILMRVISIDYWHVWLRCFMNPLRVRREKALWARRVRRNLIWAGLLMFVWLMCSGEAIAETLTERQQAFPDWQGKPAVSVSSGDLVYPQWMVGQWRMSSTLVDMVAPLAPEIVTPGFEGNRQFLHKAIPALIRFVPKDDGDEGFFERLL